MKAPEHERRAARRTKSFKIKPSSLYDRADIVVDPKFEQVVMILANLKGRTVVEDLFPDVEWATDPIFASISPPDWQFTHVRVTKLPAHLEETVPLSYT
jgi:hypothetical protein